MAYKIIVSHGVTPTGYGIRQRSNGTLRPISKCCGRTMEGPDCICKTCKESCRADSLTLSASFNNDIPITSASTFGIVKGWIERVTGLSDVEMEVKS